MVEDAKSVPMRMETRGWSAAAKSFWAAMDFMAIGAKILSLFQFADDES